MPALQDEAPRHLGVAAAAAGAAAQAVQAICLREVLEVARGGEAVLGLALALWLLGSALGAATWRGRPLLAAGLVLFLPLACVPLLRVLPVSPGGWAPLASLFALPLAYGPGAFFGSILRRAPPRPAIVREALGACLAGALLTFFLLESVPALLIVHGAGLLCVAVAARRAELVVLALLIPAGWFVGSYDARFLDARARGLWAGGELVRAGESPYGRLLWLRREGQHALFVGGQLALTSPDEVEAEAFVNVVLAAHPNPRRVLVLGPGLSGVLAECLRHPVETLEVALADPHLLEVVRAELPESDRAALARARLRIGDPRRIAAEAPRDVILSLSPPPATIATNRLYTREFFRTIDLAPGGFVAFALPAAPNEREGEVMARNVSVFRALEPLETVVLPGAHDLFLAGAEPPDVAPTTLSERLAARGIALEHHAQDFFAESYAPEEVARVTAGYRDYPARPAPAVPFAVEPRAPAAEAPEPLPNTDLHPGAVLHSAAALAREAKAPLLARATRLAPFAPAFLLPWAVLGAFAAWRRGRPAAGALAAATSGAASMGLWIVVLMAYQARVGALYGDIALLAAAFMAGFALGARLRARAFAVDMIFTAAAILVWLALPGAGRVGAVGLALAIGALGGATLSAVTVAMPKRAPALYAWDLAGAALAALVFGTFLVPALGALGACLTAAGLKMLSLVGGLRQAR